MRMNEMSGKELGELMHGLTEEYARHRRGITEDYITKIKIEQKIEEAEVKALSSPEYAKATNDTARKAVIKEATMFLRNELVLCKERLELSRGQSDIALVRLRAVDSFAMIFQAGIIEPAVNVLKSTEIRKE